LSEAAEETYARLAKVMPQPGSDKSLDAQGDKIMARVVYRKVNGHESIVAVHSVNTSSGGGGVRWYEFRLDKNRNPKLYQQGTYAPDGFFRWMASPAIDRFGNIGIGYSFGGTPHFAGQRFAGRLANDPPGHLTLRELVLAEGEAAQGAMRWEDYTQTAVDPSDDCTIWYVGDYLKKDAANYSSRIGAFRLPGCLGQAIRFLTQRRKGAKRWRVSKGFPCAFAPLRLCVRNLFVTPISLSALHSPSLPGSSLADLDLRRYH
jgi:hypothetical protein